VGRGGSFGEPRHIAAIAFFKRDRIEMKNYFVSRRRLAVCSVVAFASLISFSWPSSAAPTAAKPEAKDPVTVTDSGDSWVLDNGIVKASITKRSGRMRSLVYKGIETMGRNGGGVWEQTPDLAPELTQTVTIDPATNGGERAEVSVKGITGGTVMLTPNAPGGGTQCNLEIRYAMARGDSGVYTYAIFSHPKEYPAMSIGESRFVTFIAKNFDWISVDADRNLLACSPEDWGKGVVVHAKEQRILDQGYYKNSVEHKYSYNAVQYKIPAYGWSSTKDHIGIWFINPSIEYLSGGAEKQELVCHYHNTNYPDPVILNYWRGTHYGGGATCSLDANEEWSKVVGPMFVYCNSLDNPDKASQSDMDLLTATAGNPTVPPAWKDNATVLWQDALRQAKVETSRWPYNWVKGVDYPLQEDRGTVTGQLVLNDPQATTAKLPNLTVGLAHADYPRPARRFGGGGGKGFGRRGAGGQGGAGAGGATEGGDRPAQGTNTPPADGPGSGQGGAPAGGPGTFARGQFGPINPNIDWAHDAKYYQFWADGSDDGKFTIAMVRPGKYTLHAFADGVLGDFAQTEITVEPGKTLDLGKLEWKPVRYGKQLWDIGYPTRKADKFFKGDNENYWLWGWCLRYPLLFPNDITYTIGKSDYHKDWFFQQTPHSESTAWLNPEAKDPANQRFGWVKTESLDKYPQTDQSGPWRTYGNGRATTWTIKFDLDKAGQGQAALRIALAGADGLGGFGGTGGGLSIDVNGQSSGTIRPVATNALRYNTNKSVWQEQTVKFDAALLKQGENQIQLTVPAGQLTSGVVYDYLRLELDENAKPESTPEQKSDS
jgi:rhamnogalacturonan endolyase